MKKLLISFNFILFFITSVSSTEIDGLLHKLYADKNNNIFLLQHQQFNENKLKRSGPIFQEDIFPNIDEKIENINIVGHSIFDLIDIDASNTPKPENIEDPQQEVILESKSDSSLIKENLIAPLHVYKNRTVESFIKLYTVKKRNHFIRGLKRGQYFLKEFKEIFRSYGLPEDLVYLAIVESNFQTHAVSRASATGVWQFMSATGKIYGLEHNWWLDQRRDPIRSTHAAARYLKYLYKKFNSWEHAIASYNSGSGRVRRAIKKNIRLNKPIDFWNLKLPRETRGYVPAFFAVVTIINNMEKYNLPKSLLDYKERIKTKKYKVPGGVGLKQIASKLKIPYKQLKELNGLLILGFTPPQKKNYEIVIPKSTIITKEMIASLKKDQVDHMLTYTVKHGDNLWNISRSFGVPLYMIKQLNHHKLRKRYIKPKMKLLIPNPNKYALQKKKKRKTAKNSNYHKVKSGDSLWKIARLYGVSMNSIVKHNQFVYSKRTLLQIGKRLVIPKSTIK